MFTKIQARLERCSDLSVEDRIDAICDCFEQDWKQGIRSDLSSYLVYCEPKEQPRLLTELLSVDWELRSISGEHPSWDEYLTKLPQFADQIAALRFKHQAEVSRGNSGLNHQDLSRIAHFELLEKVGAGATGEVWKARDTLLQRTVAIKIPRTPNLSEDELSRFLREGRAAAALKHPNIAGVHEVGCAEGVAYIVSDFIAGENLRNWLKQSRPSHQRAAEICRQIAAAIAHAHQSGVIHRDLKPANVLLDEYGIAHIVDFGLAKRVSSQASLSTQSHMIGTPAYMAPEQAKGQGTDARSDVYSLGIMLYEMITGTQPFTGSMDEVICSVLTKEPIRPCRVDRSVPRDLELICLKAIAKQPADRYPSADEMMDDLNRYLSGMPIRARRYRKIVLAWHSVRRKLAILSLASIVLIASLIVLEWLQAKRAGISPIEPRSVRINSVPPGANVVFVPLSPNDGEPIAARAIKAQNVSPVQVTLAPGDYWVEAVLPDGRFHDVLRHVPKHGELSLRVENHLKWTVDKDGKVELPEIAIPEKDVTERMLLVDTSLDSKKSDPDDDQKYALWTPSFYVDAEEATVSKYQVFMPSLPNYLWQVQLQPNQPIPLVYDDAVAYAEGTGRRIPTRTEWLRAQAVLPLRSAKQLADWTNTWASRSLTITSTRVDETEDYLRLVLGGSHRLIQHEEELQPNDYDKKNWAALSRTRFFPGVGVLCVRSATPLFFKVP